MSQYEVVEFLKKLELVELRTMQLCVVFAELFRNFGYSFTDGVELLKVRHGSGRIGQGRIRSSYEK